jgi:hypothetical protein
VERRRRRERKARGLLRRLLVNWLMKQDEDSAIRVKGFKATKRAKVGRKVQM